MYVNSQRNEFEEYENEDANENEDENLICTEIVSTPTNEDIEKEKQLKKEKEKHNEIISYM